MRRSSLLLVATFVSSISVGTAAAGPAATSYEAPGLTAPPAPTPKPRSRKSPNVVTALGVTFTLLTVPLVILPEPGNAGWGPSDYAGPLILMSFGPAIGRIYAGEIGGRHLAVRGAGILALMIGGGLAGRNDEDASGRQTSVDLGVALSLVGAAVVVGDVIVDLATARDAARRYNARHAVTITPVSVAPSGTLVPGVSVAGRF